VTIGRRLARSIENPSIPISAATILEFLGGPKAHTGRPVSTTGSLAMPSVWRAVNLLAGTGASLPLKTYRDEQVPARVMLMDNPHPDLTPMEISELRFVHLLLWGNSYAQKVRDANNRIVELWPLPPSQVQVGRVQPSAANPSGKVFKLGGDDRAFTRDDILHIPGLGYDGICGVSPIRMATQAVALGLAAEEYAAKLYDSGSLMSGILQTEQRLDDVAAGRLKENWKAKVTGLDKAHEIAVLDSGAKFQPVSMPAVDAQMIESRRFQVQEIARWFGIPPHMLGDVSGSTSWGTGIEQQSIGFVVYTLRPWLTRIEQRLTREVTPQGVYAKYKVEGLLRGDSAARAEFYRVMREVGAYSANDIRELEDMRPVEGGDTRLQPLNMAPLGSETAPQGESHAG
jgi:HK97 family phage portal protein